ncbi:hypothetical protein Tco_0362643 [Tanacetum coccineum]
MPYLRFTKVIIDHFISKDNTISMRNRINLHTARDDSLLGALKFVSKIEDCQKYGALIPDGMINDDTKLSTAYKIYIEYATRKVPPKKARKFKKPASPKLKTVPASPKEPTQKGKRVKRPAKKATIAPNDRDLLLFGCCTTWKKLVEENLMRRSMQTKDTSEGTGVKPRVPDVSKEDSSDSDDDSWGNGDDENDDFNDEDNDGHNDEHGGNDEDSGNDDGSNDAQDIEQTDSDHDENPFFTLKDYEEEEQDEEYVFTPEKDKYDDEEMMYEEEDDDVAKELEDQQNASHESGFVKKEDDGHVTLTTVHDKTEGTMKSSSVSSDFTSKLLNLDNTGPDVNEIASLLNASTVPPPPPPVNPSLHLATTPQQQTPDSTITTTHPTMTLPKIPNFASLFWFEQRVFALETKMSEFNQTSQFAEANSLILGIVDQYLAYKMKEAVDVAVQLQSNKLKEEAEA